MSVRSALPQSYLKNPGTVVENFGTFSEWVNGAPTLGEISADTEHYRGGATSSVRLSAHAGQIANVYKNFSPVLDLSQFGDGSVFRLWIYIPDTVYVSNIYPNFYNTVSSPWTHAFTFFDFSAQRSVAGWNCLTLRKDQFTVNQGFNWASIVQVRFQLTALAGMAASVSFAEVSFGAEGLPRLMVQFDDSVTSEFSEGYAYLSSKGKPATLWVIPSRIDTAGYLSLANLNTLYAAGWALGNHTWSHPNKTKIIVTAAAVDTSLKVDSTTCAVSGAGKDAAQIATELVVVINASQSAVVATDFGNGTFWLSGGTVTVLVNCAAYGTGIAHLSLSGQRDEIRDATDWLIFSGFPRAARHLAYPVGPGNAVTWAAMTELGILTGRGVVPWVEPTPAGKLYGLHGAVVSWGDIAHGVPDYTVATVCGWIDKAIATGSTLTLVFHGLRAAGGILYTVDYLISDFRAIIDYAVQTGIRFCTIDEWYEGLTDPRYRSLLLGR
jgi:hypothetical protein